MAESQDDTDLYELLQVHPKAEAEIIKKAYRTIMQRLHPDLGGDELLARRVNKAYEILSDSDRRTAYDRHRQARLKARLRLAAAEKGQALIKLPSPDQPPPIPIDPACPILSGEGVIVADERNDRVLILAANGEIAWQFGGAAATATARLRRPRHASFTPEGHRLIVDTGTNRVLEVDAERQTLWTCESGLQAPVFAQRLPSGTTLIVEADAKRVVEIAPDGHCVWQATVPTPPMAAWRLDGGETLVSDGQHLRRLAKSGKLTGSLPPIHWFGRWRWGRRPWHGANFAVPLGRDALLIASDRVAAIDRQGRYLWQFDGLPQADIRQAYVLANGQLLVDFVHLVKRGVNQEVVLLDEGRRPLWRHYYSQHRFI